MKIPLGGKYGQGKYAEIDDDLAPLLEGYCAWRANRTGYVCGDRRITSANKKPRYVLLHRIVAGVLDEPRVEVDHIDNDPLNCRLSNLQLGVKTSKAFKRLQAIKQKKGATRADKASKYPGVAWHKRHRKWEVRMVSDSGKNEFLGSFDDEEEAAAVYKAKLDEEIPRLQAQAEHDFNRMIVGDVLGDIVDSIVAKF